MLTSRIDKTITHQWISVHLECVFL